MIILGIVIRRYYKRRESCSTEKNFDFDMATRGFVFEKILTESLMDNPLFVFEDLLYHAHRISVIGCNTYQSPWMIHSEPTIEIENAVIKDEFYKFSLVDLEYTNKEVQQNCIVEEVGVGDSQHFSGGLLPFLLDLANAIQKTEVQGLESIPIKKRSGMSFTRIVQILEDQFK